MLEAKFVLTMWWRSNAVVYTAMEDIKIRNQDLKSILPHQYVALIHVDDVVLIHIDNVILMHVDNTVKIDGYRGCICKM